MVQGLASACGTGALACVFNWIYFFTIHEHLYNLQFMPLLGRTA